MVFFHKDNVIRPNAQEATCFFRIFFRILCHLGVGRERENGRCERGKDLPTWETNRPLGRRTMGWGGMKCNDSSEKSASPGATQIASEMAVFERSRRDVGALDAPALSRAVAVRHLSGCDTCLVATRKTMYCAVFRHVPHHETCLTARRIVEYGVQDVALKT